MPSPTRRRLLTSVAGLSVLAGCTSDRSQGSPGGNATSGTATRSSTPTQGGTPTPTDRSTGSPASQEERVPSAQTATPSTDSVPASLASDLEFVVAVVWQPTDDAPGRVRAALTNHTSGSLELGGGDPLPVGDSLDVEEVDASTPMVLFPQQSDVVNDYYFGEMDEPATVEDAVRDGCWRLPETVGSTTAGMRVSLPDRASIVADYFPLGTPDGGCPDGRYATHGEMTARVESDESGHYAMVETTMEVRVAPDGSLAAEGSLITRAA